MRYVSQRIIVGLVFVLCACAGSPATPTAVGGLVTILSPVDGAVVNTPYVEVQGQAPPNTVLTLNDEIVVVDTTEIFTVQVPLTEGPNQIQIIASNAEGLEIDFELVVTFDPESE